MRNLSQNSPKIPKILIIPIIPNTQIILIILNIPKTPTPPSQRSANTIFTHRKHHVCRNTSKNYTIQGSPLLSPMINPKILRQIKAFF